MMLTNPAAKTDFIFWGSPKAYLLIWNFADMVIDVENAKSKFYLSKNAKFYGNLKAAGIQKL